MLPGRHAVSQNGWRELLFSGVILGLSSFGQTFFISLYGDEIRQDFALSNAEFGSIYAMATIGGAVALSWLGGLIDRIDLKTYTLYSAIFLVSACIGLSFAYSVTTLVVSVFALRLGGQGLMAHISFTAAARFFPEGTGRAVGLVALGYCVAQAIFPIYAVTVNDIFNWRVGWALNAGVVIVGALLALRLLPALPRRCSSSGISPGDAPMSTVPTRLLDKRFFMALPVTLMSPFLMSCFLFHQSALAAEKSWELSWLAAGFIAFAIAQAVIFFVSGPLIDRAKPSRVLPFFLLPQAIALLLIYVSASPFIIPVYLTLMGATSAMATVLSGSLWVELYGTDRYGRIRALAESANVLAMGVSPIAMGALLDTGVSISNQAGLAIIPILLVSVISLQFWSVSKPALAS